MRAEIKQRAEKYTQSAPSLLTLVCLLFVSSFVVGDFLAARIGRILKENLTAASASNPSDPLDDVAVTAPAASASSSKAKKVRNQTEPRNDVPVTTNTTAAPAPVRAASIPMLPVLPSIFSPATLGSVAPSPPPAALASPSTHSTSHRPECPFGELCYRNNPAHFTEYTHPHQDASATKPTKRYHEEVILLSDDDDDADADAHPSKSKRLKSISSPPPSLALHEDDFLDDEEIFDLTTPSPPQPQSMPTADPRDTRPTPGTRSVLTSTPGSSTTPAIAAARPPVHSATPAAAGWSLPQPTAAAVARKPDKAYRPKAGTSPHALLLALVHSPTPLNKSQLLDAAIAHYPSHTASNDARVTLWAGVSNLIARDLINKALTPVRYSLTETGMATARALLPAGSPIFTSPADDFLSPIDGSPAPVALVAAGRSPSTGRNASPSPSPPPGHSLPLTRRCMDAADWEVVLIIDVRSVETRKKHTHTRTRTHTFITNPTYSDASSFVAHTVSIARPPSLSLFLSERSGNKDAAYMIEKLGKRGLVCESRALSVGDFMWVARHKLHRTCEVVLDTLIERKRVGDLVSSIRDGRYHEQRSRLKKTKLKRILYIIEGRIAEDTVIGLPIKTVENVITSMNVGQSHLTPTSRAYKPTRTKASLWSPHARPLG